MNPSPPNHVFKPDLTAITMETVLLLVTPASSKSLKRVKDCFQLSTYPPLPVNVPLAFSL